MSLKEQVLEMLNHAIGMAGINQSELARRLQVSPAYVCQVLKSRSGHRYNLTMDQAERIAGACGFQLAVTLAPGTRRA